MNKKFIQLGAFSLNKNKVNCIIDFSDIEKELDILFPSEYKNLFFEIGDDSISFEKGAKYFPDNAPPIVDKNGYLSLDFLYGVTGKDNLVQQNQVYRHQLPSNLITIGEVLSGDQICIDKINNNIVYWWHEATIDEKQTYKIANSFIDFISKLEPDNEMSINNTIGIIKSESHLDF